MTGLISVSLITSSVALTVLLIVVISAGLMPKAFAIELVMPNITLAPRVFIVSFAEAIAIFISATWAALKVPLAIFDSIILIWFCISL